MDLNPKNYNLMEITKFFGLQPNHSFTQVNDSFRKKHSEILVSSQVTKEEKDKMLFFINQLKDKLVLHLTKQNVPNNTFLNSLPNNFMNKTNSRIDTVINSSVAYNAGVSKQISADTINPIERNILNNVIHFDTRFKQNYVVQNQSKFTFNFPTSFKNVISTRLISFELPDTIYNITEKLSNNSFNLNVLNWDAVKVTIFSAGNDSLIAFNIIGITGKGDSYTEKITGGNGSAVTSTTTFIQITSITAVGNPAGNVSAGLKDRGNDIISAPAAVNNNAALVLAKNVKELVLTAKIKIASAANDSGITFAITGKKFDGTAESETLTGAAAGATVVSVKRYSSITSIIPSGNTAGNIEVGLFYRSVANDLATAQTVTAGNGVVFTKTLESFVSLRNQKDITITLDEGKYTGTTLITEIQSKLQESGNDTQGVKSFIVSNNANTGKINISHGYFDFFLRFPGAKDKVNLGYILGFRSEVVNSSSNSVTASNIADFDFNNYFYLSFDDFQRSVNHNHFAIMNKNFITKNIFAKLKNKQDDGNTDYFVKKNYFGPVTLDKVSFELLDRYGNSLDLKGLDYSFSVELELLYKY